MLIKYSYYDVIYVVNVTPMTTMYQRDMLKRLIMLEIFKIQILTPRLIMYGRKITTTNITFYDNVFTTRNKTPRYNTLMHHVFFFFLNEQTIASVF